MKLKFMHNGKRKEFELWNSTDENIDYMEVLSIMAYEITINKEELIICDTLSHHIEETDYDDVESEADYKNLFGVPDNANVVFNPNPENTEYTYYEAPDEILNDRNKIAKYCLERYSEEWWETTFNITKD